MILTLRTDSAMAEIGLHSADGQELEVYQWEAGRNLSSELLGQLIKLLERHNGSWKQLKGVVVFQGPGSFTGLRIGITVANTIAYGQDIPIVGELGGSWATNGLLRLKSGEDDKQVMPHYGAEPNITKPRA